MTRPLRYPQFLGQRYRAILAYTGLVGVVVSLLILSPLVLLAAYPQESPLAWAFLGPGLGLGVPSVLLWRLLIPRTPVSLTRQEGAVIVVLSWLLALLVGSIPFLPGSGLSLTQALFEATSGWTTAGLSVLDVEQGSPLLLFYRSVIQLAGGAGLAILMLSALAGPVGPGLSVAEGREEQLLPHVRRSIRLVLSMYAGYVVVGIALLSAVGMSWFDAVNHAFTALSTGGFSTRAASIAYWDSPAVEGAVIALMLLGTLNFLTAYTLFRGKLRAVARSSEVRQSTLLLVLGTLVLFFGVTSGLYPSLSQRVRVAVFNAVSALSTTGFSTVDYRPWSSLGWLVLILLMLVGGGTGSTAGGIKQYRIYALFRGLVWEVRRRLLPRRAVTEPDVWRGEERQFLSDTHLRQVALFVFLYLVVFLVGSGVLTAYGYPLQDSLFEFASALGTVGISVGITAPNAPAGVLWTQMGGMVLGRLEFFTVVVGITRLLRDVPTLASAGWQSRLAAIPSIRLRGLPSLRWRRTRAQPAPAAVPEQEGKSPHSGSDDTP
jgi:trk system potassium uptake protein TrkH